MRQPLFSLFVGAGLCVLPALSSLDGTTAARAEDAAQTRARLAYSVPQGLQYSFQQSQTLDSALVVSGGGRSVNVQQQTQIRLDGIAAVTRVANGRPVELRVRFSPNSGMQIVTNGMPDPQPFALAGREAIIRVANDEVAGITVTGGAPINDDKALREMIEPVVVFESQALPGRTVSVGDEWTANIVEPDGSGRTTLAMKVMGFQSRGSRPVAVLAGQGTMTSTRDGTSMNGPVSANAMVDTATGLPLEFQGTGNIQINGSSLQDGQRITLNGTGRLLSLLRIGLDGAGRATPPSQPFAQAPMPQRPNSQAQPPRQSQRSGATPPGDPRIVGAYRGESVSGGADIGIYTNTQLWWVFRSDGTVYYGAQTYFNAEKRDYNQRQEYTAHGNSAGNVDEGRWSTQGKFLSIRWNDGRTLYVQYGIEPDGTLVFRNARTGKIINYYPRVRS
ncbi:MAG: hypothetical protein ACFB6R_11825 [Alphaproteobacteria bacterium]